MVTVLREADRTTVAEAAKKHKVSEPTIYACITPSPFQPVSVVNQVCVQSTAKRDRGDGRLLSPDP